MKDRKILKILGGILLLLFISATGYVLWFNAQLPESNTIEAYDTRLLKTTQLDEDELWSLIQHWRESEGLSKYKKNTMLCDIAEERAPEIKGEIDTPHSGFADAIKEYPSTISFTENNTGALSEEDALNRWLNSKTHAEALRDDFEYSCVATDGVYAVQIFSNL